VSHKWLKPEGFIPEPIVPVQPKPQHLPEERPVPAVRKRRSYVLGGIAMILLLGVVFLALKKNLLSVGTRQSISQSLDLELPPFIQKLVFINSFAALSDSLAQVELIDSLKHEMESQNAGTIVCHNNCFEIGVVGDQVRYFAIKIGQRSLDLISGKFLSKAKLSEPAMAKYALLFYFIQAQTIVESQPPLLRKRLEETESLFSEMDGDRHAR
jgi:hypothetical protein